MLLQRAGAALSSGLTELQRRHPQLLTNVRGQACPHDIWVYQVVREFALCMFVTPCACCNSQGTFCAFDAVQGGASRDAMLTGMSSRSQASIALACALTCILQPALATYSSSLRMSSSLHSGLKHRGIWAGGCGDRSIRLRPALVFTEHHASIFLHALGDTVASMENTAAHT